MASIALGNSKFQRSLQDSPLGTVLRAETDLPHSRYVLPRVHVKLSGAETEQGGDVASEARGTGITQINIFVNLWRVSPLG